MNPILTQKLKAEIDYLLRGIKCTVLNQLDCHHKRSNLCPSTLSVIDIACGDGNYSRTICDQFNYHRILGVDICSDQIQRAKSLKTALRHRSAITFQCLDCATFHHSDNPLNGTQFDIALAIWFFSYAENKEMLSEYIRSAFSVLKPGGILIAATAAIEDINAVDNGLYADDPRFGFKVEFADSVKREGPFLLKIGPNIESTEFTDFDFIYEDRTYHRLCGEAGFSEMHFLSVDDYKLDETATVYDQMLFYSNFCR